MRRKNSNDEADFQLDLTKQAALPRRDSMGLPVGDPLEYSDDESCNQAILKELREEQQLEEQRDIERMKESMHSQQSCQSSSSRATNSQDRKRQRRAIFEKYKKLEQPTPPEQNDRDLLLAFDNIFKKRETILSRKATVEERQPAQQAKFERSTKGQQQIEASANMANTSDNSLVVMDANDDQLADTLKQGLWRNGSLKSSGPLAAEEVASPNPIEVVAGELNPRMMSNLMREESMMGGGFSKIYPIEKHNSSISVRESHDLEDLLKENIFNDMSQIDVNRSNILTASLHLRDSFRLMHASAIKQQNEPKIDSEKELGSQNQNPNCPNPPSEDKNLPSQLQGLLSPAVSMGSASSKEQLGTETPTVQEIKTPQAQRLFKPPSIATIPQPFVEPVDTALFPVRQSPVRLKQATTIVDKTNPFVTRISNSPSSQTIAANLPSIPQMVPSLNEMASPIRTPISKMEEIMSPTPISHRFNQPQAQPAPSLELMEAIPQNSIPQLLRQAFRLNSTSANLNHPKIHTLAAELRSQLTSLVRELTKASNVLRIFNEELLHREANQVELRSHFRPETFLQGNWALPLSNNINIIKPAGSFERRPCDHIQIQAKLGECQDILKRLQTIISDSARMDFGTFESKKLYVAVRYSLNDILQTALKISEDLYVKAFVMHLPDHYIVFYQYLRTIPASSHKNLKGAIKEKQAMQVLVDYLRESGDPLCASVIGRDIRLKLENETARLKRNYYQQKHHQSLA